MKRPYQVNETRDGKVRCRATFSTMEKAWARLVGLERLYPYLRGAFHVASNGKRLT